MRADMDPIASISFSEGVVKKKREKNGAGASFFSSGLIVV